MAIHKMKDPGVALLQHRLQRQKRIAHNRRHTVHNPWDIPNPRDMVPHNQDMVPHNQDMDNSQDMEHSQDMEATIRMVSNQLARERKAKKVNLHSPRIP